MTLWNQHVILCCSSSCVLLIDKSNERCKFSTYRSSRPKMFCKKGVLLLWRTSEQLLLDLMVLLTLLLILKWLPSNWSYPLNVLKDLNRNENLNLNLRYLKQASSSIKVRIGFTNSRNSHRRCSIKIGVLKKFEKFTVSFLTKLQNTS